MNRFLPMSVLLDLSLVIYGPLFSVGVWGHFDVIIINCYLLGPLYYYPLNLENFTLISVELTPILK